MMADQVELFSEKPYVGAKVSTEAHRAWRDRNREHVREKSRERAQRRNHSAYMRNWRKKNRDKIAAHERRARLKKYGLTPADYDRLLIAQDGCCAICRRHVSTLNRKNRRQKHIRLDVDHCHASGKVRALLCYNCNAILGHAKDCIKTLVATIAYLRANGVEP